MSVHASNSGPEARLAPLRRLAFALALLIAAGEIARYWGRAAFVPMALDELAVAALLIWAGLKSRSGAAAPLAAAWGAFCGLMLVLLVQNADHLFRGPPKAHAGLYVAALSALLLVGAWALRRSLVLARD